MSIKLNKLLFFSLMLNLVGIILITSFLNGRFPDNYYDDLIKHIGNISNVVCLP